MIKNITIVALICLSGCNNQQKESELESRLNNLEQENKDLRQKLNNIPQIADPEPIDRLDTPSSNSQYAFVRLIVEQEEYDVSGGGYKTVAFNFCSSIDEYTNMDNDTKYKLMDQVQGRYLSSTAQFKKGSVKDRECFVFSSYEDASKKREEFLVDKE